MASVSGLCFSDGGSTTNRLPSGLHLCEECVKDWRSREWLDEALRVTEEFFRAHPWVDRVTGPEGIATGNPPGESA